MAYHLYPLLYWHHGWHYRWVQCLHGWSISPRQYQHVGIYGLRLRCILLFTDSFMHTYQILLARLSQGKQYILITPNNIDHVLAEPPVVQISRMDDPRNWDYFHTSEILTSWCTQSKLADQTIYTDLNTYWLEIYCSSRNMMWAYGSTENHDCSLNFRICIHTVTVSQRTIHLAVTQGLEWWIVQPLHRQEHTCSATLLSAKS